MKTRIKIFLPIFFCLQVFAVSLTAQTQDTVKVLLAVHPAKDRILLRWAVQDASAWKKSLSKGYIIEKITVRRAGKILSDPEPKILTPAPLSAAPEEQWTELGSRNQYAAILAQALFGEDFEVDGFGSGSPDPVSRIIQSADALSQRYSFALYAADMCFEAACLAGWGYEDRDVRPGEFYLYRVTPAGFDNLKYKVEYGFAYTGVDETQALPRPVDVQALFGDKLVQIYWNTSLYGNMFSSYYVEKSEDNVRFERPEMPFTPLDSKDYAMYTDSLSENGKMYYYRVRGLNIFGEVSEPSDAVSGQGAESLNAAPFITRSQVLESGEAEIEWVFEETAEPLIGSFELLRSDNDKDPYLPVVSNISANERIVKYDKLKPSNYFRVAARGLNGKQSLSYPVLLMPIDSIPPGPPKKLTAQADTTGIVTLQWEKNTEPDMLGYKVFRGNVKGEELVPVSQEPQSGTLFVDTVDLMNLNASVYYAVVAFDTHYNQSDFSEIIEVEKPLKVKPSSPVFVEYRSESDGITLRWIPSPGKEVALHTIYRRDEKETEAAVLKTFPVTDTTTVYKDITTEGNKTYIYTVTASSKWQVESNPSPEYRISALPAEKVKALEELKAIIDTEKKQVHLTWKVSGQGKVKAWKVYRAENEAPLSLWRTLPVPETGVDDNNPPLTGDMTQYMVVAEMNDGGLSFPEKITVKF